MRALLVLLLAAGCARPGDTANAAAGLEVRAIEPGGDSEGWRLEIVNHTEAPVALDDVPLRWDALQPSGDWVPADYDLGYGFPPTGERPSVVPAFGSVALDLAIRRGPGTYRVLPRFEDPEARPQLGVELSIVGWPSEIGRRGEALRERAAAEGCRPLARRIDQALRDDLEPDPLAELHLSTVDPERRTELAGEMLARGGFVDHLVRELEFAPLSEVTPLAGQIRHARPDVQRAVREVIARRMSELFERPEPIDVMDLRNFEQIADAWPDDVGPTLVERLATGPEEGVAAVELVNVFVYARSEGLTDHAAAILDALDARCAGAEDEALVEACASARERFSDPDGLWLVGRGWGSSHCGGYYSDPSPVCQSLRERWDALTTEAGEPEVVLH